MAVISSSGPTVQEVFSHVRS